jgi:DNA-binding MarR family transcriptional regulator
MPSPISRQKLSEVADTCACFNLRRTTRVITQMYDDALRPSGIRITQFTLLAFVAGYDRMSIGELAAATDTDRTTLTRNLEVLRGAGLVLLDQGDDPRSRLVALTPAGRDVLAQALPLWQKAQRRITRRLGVDRFADLRDQLAAVSAAATD